MRGYKVPAGKMVMGAKGSGERNAFDIEQCARDIDRKIQDKMYEQPALNTWGIFHGDKDAQVAKQFSSTLDEVLKQFGFINQAPRTFTVKGNPMQGRSWVQELKNNLNKEV